MVTVEDRCTYGEFDQTQHFKIWTYDPDDTIQLFNKTHLTVTAIWVSSPANHTSELYFHKLGVNDRGYVTYPVPFPVYTPKNHPVPGWCSTGSSQLDYNETPFMVQNLEEHGRAVRVVAATGIVFWESMVEGEAALSNVVTRLVWTTYNRFKATWKVPFEDLFKHVYDEPYSLGSSTHKAWYCYENGLLYFYSCVRAGYGYDPAEGATYHPYVVKATFKNTWCGNVLRVDCCTNTLAFVRKYGSLLGIDQNSQHRNVLDVWSHFGVYIPAGERVPLSDQTANTHALKMPLKPYQKDNVLAMKNMERLGFGKLMFSNNGYLPGDIYNPNFHFFRQPVCDYTSVNKLCENPETVFGGGLLADEMGMGKTMTVLGLIVDSLAENRNNQQPTTNNPNQNNTRQPTLIVCPLNMIAQWELEIAEKTTITKVFKYHGANIKKIQTSQHLNAYDIVLTTPSTLQRRKSADAPAWNGHVWHRVIIDEAHLLSQSELDALPLRRMTWCLSATPLANLDRIMSALQLTRPGSIIGNSKVSYLYQDVRWYALSQVLLRHKKTDVEAVDLPPKSEHLVPLVMSKQERQIYDESLQLARLMSQNRGRMQAIIRLRRLCSLGCQEARLQHQHVDGIIQGTECIPDGTDDVCAICLDPFDDNAIVTVCNHWFCKQCLLNWKCTKSTCPVCRQPIKEMRTGVKRAAAGDVEVAVENAGPSDAGPSESPDNTIQPTTKLEELATRLLAMPAESQALVFSQFNGTINTIKAYLEQRAPGLRVGIMHGGSSIAQRKKTLSQLQSGGVRVVLMSIGTCAVGLNLTTADHVFFMEPVYNKSAEIQAVARAWRQGQTKPVNVYHMLYENTIESNIRAHHLNSSVDLLA